MSCNNSKIVYYNILILDKLEDDKHLTFLDFIFNDILNNFIEVSAKNKKYMSNEYYKNTKNSTRKKRIEIFNLIECYKLFTTLLKAFRIHPSYFERI